MKVCNKIKICFSVLLLVGVLTGCSDSSSSDALNAARPTVISTFPANAGTHMPLDGNVSATFNKEMAPETITTATFILRQGATIVPGIVTYEGTVATLNPTADLATDTIYSATITTGATDLTGKTLLAKKSWSFTTGNTMPIGPASVNLGAAGNFVILAESGISTVPASAITGDIGLSPAAASFMTGFSLTSDSTNTFSTSPQITGKAYASNYTSPTDSNLTTAVNNMMTAYVDAAGRPTPDFTEYGAGDISGLTLVPGLYKWSTGVLISTDVTLNGNGGSDDVWIFQISGDITMASAAKILLDGGAMAKNIFWQTPGAVALDTTAHLEGIVLSQTQITLATGATANGRLLSQTAVTMDQSTVTQPAQ